MVAGRANAINMQRRAGVLLHPTSLPGALHGGDIGHQAYRFIEFLNAHGFKVWQMLPMGPTHNDKSPYQCLSAHAGNSLLISLDWLEDKGWLDRSKIDEPEEDQLYRIRCLQFAAEFFYQMEDEYWDNALATFKRDNIVWLDDYVLFTALKEKFNNLPWYEWPDDVRHREKGVLEKEEKLLKQPIKQAIFEQFIFFTQWQEVRDYAKKYDVELFGDMPIFVAKDSADVWAMRKNFLMNADGDMDFVAGVPPDAFSDTGQRWGNPLYDWKYMALDEFSWWKERFRSQLKLFDIVRVDHFRGLQAVWQIPAEDETAINGAWVKVPGKAMLKEMYKTFQSLPLVAEDLGVITEKVIKLKKSFHLPGMKVLQFAFDGNTANPHLPHQHEPEDVIYTGTHDNDTTLGWAKDVKNYNRKFLQTYSSCNENRNEPAKEISDENTFWIIVRMAMSSVSFLSVIPMQDILMGDSTTRMNIPGTTTGNWEWRFEWNRLNQDVLEKISGMLVLYQRADHGKK